MPVKVLFIRHSRVLISSFEASKVNGLGLVGA